MCCSPRIAARCGTRIAAHDGVEVDSQGDAFFVAFPRAHDAVAAAIDAQRTLAAGEVRVRMALHTASRCHNGGYYVGVDISRRPASAPRRTAGSDAGDGTTVLGVVRAP